MSTSSHDADGSDTPSDRMAKRVNIAPIRLRLDFIRWLVSIVIANDTTTRERGGYSLGTTQAGSSLG